MTIRAFVGPNGGGKSLGMTAKMALPALRDGQVVVSNYRLHPERLGFAAWQWMPLESWRQIPRLGVQHSKMPGPSLTRGRPACLLLDEITAVLPSRGYASVPAELLRVLNQLRKPQLTVGWTAPAWSRADVVLREVTKLVTLCRGRMPDPWVRGTDGKPLRDASGKKVPERGAWPVNRLFTFATYDATTFEEFSLDQAQGQRLRPIAVQRYWRPSGRSWPSAGKEMVGAHLLYDSLESVGLLDHVEAGECVGCGGKVRTRYCECGPKKGDRPVMGAVAVPDVPVGPVRRPSFVL